MTWLSLRLVGLALLLTTIAIGGPTINEDRDYTRRVVRRTESVNPNEDESYTARGFPIPTDANSEYAQCIFIFVCRLNALLKRLTFKRDHF